MTYRSYLTLALGLLLPLKLSAVEPPPDGGYFNGNTAEGEDALYSLTTDGADHTAVGFHAIHNLLAQDSSTTVGSLTLSTTTATYGPNTAVGFQALLNNGVSFNNSVIGINGLMNNSSNNFENQAVGANVLTQASPTGVSAIGSGALQIGEGGNSVAFGYHAQALSSNSGYNVAVGSNALLMANGMFNVAVGTNALSQVRDFSERNIAIGFNAGCRLTKHCSGNIEIGNEGRQGDIHTTRIGLKRAHATYLAGINGVTVPDADGLVIGHMGQLGTRTSSRDDDEDIQPMARASEVIYQLRPVTLHYKQQFDKSGHQQFGLVAEEVAKVAPALVARDAAGRPYSVKYQAVDAMVLNEFLKSERQADKEDQVVRDEGAELEQLTKKVTQLQQRLVTQTVTLQNLRGHSLAQKTRPVSAESFTR